MFTKFPHGHFFFFLAIFTTVHSITQKQTLEHTLSKCKSFITIYSETNTMLFCDYPICFQTPLGSLRPAPHQLSGKAVQHGSKTNVTNISRAVTFFIHEHVYISTNIHLFQCITQSIHSIHFCCCYQNQSNRCAFTNTVSLKVGETTMQHSGKSSSE